MNDATSPPRPLMKCPVCGAKFRSDPACSRCGTDLTALMRIAARAYVARQRSREALQAGDLANGFRWWAAARKLQIR